MRVSKFFRWVLYIFGMLIGGILLILVVLALVPVKIDLSEYKGAVESAATLALERTVKVDDKIVIATSLQPYFILEGLRVANPKGFQTGDFLRMKDARIQVRVLPLLRGKIHVTEVNVKGLSVELVENENGAVNWTSGISDASPPKPPSQVKPPSVDSEKAISSTPLTRASCQTA